MTKGYWSGRVDGTDPEAYKMYVAANAEPFKQYGARFLVRAGQFQNPEGILGVSAQTIYNWEVGTTRHSKDQITKIAVLRKMGKREVQQRLAQIT